MCEHKNKTMVNYSYYAGLHDTTYECEDCGETFIEIDPPIIYEYRDMIEFCGTYMYPEDKEKLLEKKETVNNNK